MRQRATALILVLFVAPSCVWAAAGLNSSRAIANLLIDGQLQKALDLSIANEDSNRKHIDESFADQYLKGAYLVSAQILTAQGKFDMASDRLHKAKEITGETFLVNLDELMGTTEGYLLERSGRAGEAVDIYRKLATPYALVRLGEIYLAAGHTDDALRVIRDSLKDDPSSPAAHAILGEILERTDKSAALLEYRRALTFAAERLTVVALVYMDVARAKKGIERLQ